MDLNDALPGVRTALMRGDVAEAGDEVDRILALGHPRREVLDDLLAPVLRDIGQRWADSEVSLIQEHVASSAAEAIVARMRSRSLPAIETSPWLVCTLQDEQHRMGAQMAAATLTELGIPVDFAETLTPEAVIEAAAERPGVCIACAGPWSIKHARAAALGVAALGTPVLVGGRGWEEWSGHRTTPGVTFIESMDDLAVWAQTHGAPKG